MTSMILKYFLNMMMTIFFANQTLAITPLKARFRAQVKVFTLHVILLKVKSFILDVLFIRRVVEFPKTVDQCPRPSLSIRLPPAHMNPPMVSLPFSLPLPKPATCELPFLFLPSIPISIFSLPFFFPHHPSPSYERLIPSFL